MSQNFVERTAESITDSAHQASRASSAIGEAIEDGLGTIRQSAKQGCDVAEEFLNATTQRLQRHLALTVAMTFAAGATAGALMGWIMRRR
jgi:hypothetical protein